jgi:hypothetical protein
MQSTLHVFFFSKDEPWLHVIGILKYSEGQTIFIDGRAASEFLNLDNKIDIEYVL